VSASAVLEEMEWSVAEESKSYSSHHDRRKCFLGAGGGEGCNETHRAVRMFVPIL